MGYTCLAGNAPRVFIVSFFDYFFGVLLLLLAVFCSPWILNVPLFIKYVLKHSLCVNVILASLDEICVHSMIGLLQTSRFTITLAQHTQLKIIKNPIPKFASFKKMQWAQYNKNKSFIVYLSAQQIHPLLSHFPFITSHRNLANLLLLLLLFLFVVQ